MSATTLATGLLLAAVAAHAGAPSPPAAPAPVRTNGAGILDAVRAPGAKAVLVNVWATWCAPCREEFPNLVKVARELAPRGLRVVLVSADFPGLDAEIRRFLTDQGVDFTTYYREGSDEAFIDAMSPDWSGAIPATFLYDGHGKLVRFWEGKASYPVIERRALDALALKEKP